jgi:hypothetical protein
MTDSHTRPDGEEKPSKALLFVFMLPMLAIMACVVAIWVGFGTWIWSTADAYRWAWMTGYGAVSIWLVGYSFSIVSESWRNILGDET